MTPKELLERARAETFQDGAGRTGTLELAPGLAEEELATFQGRLPGPLPADVRALLLFARGFAVLEETVDFTGEIESEFAPAFPCGVPVYTDGFGSFWIVHVGPDTGEWAPVLFSPYDPPVVVVQSETLVDFLQEVFNLLRPGRVSALDRVYQAAFDVWSCAGGLRRVAEVRDSPDPVVRAFAAGLKDEDYVADLRGTVVGTGFPWGRFGSDTVVRRHGGDLLFAIETPRWRGLLHRLFRSR